jgi:hypothetical protein
MASCECLLLTVLPRPAHLSCLPPQDPAYQNLQKPVKVEGDEETAQLAILAKVSPRAMCFWWSLCCIGRYPALQPVARSLYTCLS